MSSESLSHLKKQMFLLNEEEISTPFLQLSNSEKLASKALKSRDFKEILVKEHNQMSILDSKIDFLQEKSNENGVL